MQCRPNCGACCIAPSISSSIPGMPNGKPAGVACVNLDMESKACRIWGTKQYPKVCREFQAMEDACGSNADEAMERIAALELLTAMGD